MRTPYSVWLQLATLVHFVWAILRNGESFESTVDRGASYLLSVMKSSESTSDKQTTHWTAIVAACMKKV